MEYKIVYEVSNQGMKLFWIMPVLFIIIGISITWYYFICDNSRSVKRIFYVAFGLIFSAFAFFITLFVAPSEISGYFKTKETYENGNYKITEGVIENFVPMPYGGHMNESFEVDGVKFEYSDYDESYYGFNNTSSHGGPIRNNGQQVRLSYITEDDRNIILKIEIHSDTNNN